MSRQSRFSKYLRILYGTPLKNEREIKEILRVRKIIAEIKNSKVIKRNRRIFFRKQSKKGKNIEKQERKK